MRRRKRLEEKMSRNCASWRVVVVRGSGNIAYGHDPGTRSSSGLGKTEVRPTLKLLEHTAENVGQYGMKNWLPIVALNFQNGAVCANELASLNERGVCRSGRPWRRHLN